MFSNGQENPQGCRKRMLLQKYQFLLKSLKNGKKGRNNQLFIKLKLLLKHIEDHLLSFSYQKFQGIFNLFKITEEKLRILLGTASIFIIREIQQKQAWISEVYEENRDKKLSFVGKFSINEDPIKVADDIVTTLNINPFHYSAENPIREWIDKAESKGIFISRTSFIHSRLKLDSEELQGFAISDQYAPFVFVNSEDWDAPQLFTLVHELAHIWIAASGISNEIEPDIKYKETSTSCRTFLQ